MRCVNQTVALSLSLTVWPDDMLRISVENTHSDGTETLDIDSSGTGERLIQQFAEQIGAEVSRSKDATRFLAQIEMPLEG